MSTKTWETPPFPSGSGWRTWLLPFIVVCLFVFIGGSVMLSQDGEDDADVAPTVDISTLSDEEAEQLLLPELRDAMDEDEAQQAFEHALDEAQGILDRTQNVWDVTATRQRLLDALESGRSTQAEAEVLQDALNDIAFREAEALHTQVYVELGNQATPDDVEPVLDQIDRLIRDHPGVDWGGLPQSVQSLRQELGLPSNVP